jgi:8-oxo-dGTP pyrophosphatase MutT (NUDIX family)
MTKEAPARRPVITQRKPRIRAVSICVIRDKERILVAEYYDKKKDEVFHRPLGGTIEFGETGVQAVMRELLEEIGAHLEQVTFLGMLENLFVYEGLPGHEIVLVYEARMQERYLYEQESQVGDEMGEPFKVVWKRLDAFGTGREILYPEGLLALLK